MIDRRFLLLFLILLLPTASLRATSNHRYGPDEYVTVSNGISPDAKYAITAHGEGDLGDYDFHLYLTDNRTGRNLGPLTEIKEPLDTGADAFAARWSQDSREVTLVYRVDRHAPLKAITYRISGRGARRIKGPLDVESEELIKYWHGSGGSSASPKVFGTPAEEGD